MRGLTGRRPEMLPMPPMAYSFKMENVGILSVSHAVDESYGIIPLAPTYDVNFGEIKDEDNGLANIVVVTYKERKEKSLPSIIYQRGKVPLVTVPVADNAIGQFDQEINTLSSEIRATGAMLDPLAEDQLRQQQGQTLAGIFVEDVSRSAAQILAARLSNEAEQGLLRRLRYANTAGIAGSLLLGATVGHPLPRTIAVGLAMGIQQVYNYRQTADYLSLPHSLIAEDTEQGFRAVFHSALHAAYSAGYMEEQFRKSFED